MTDAPRREALAAEHAAIDELKTRLAQIPTEIWPWGFAAEVAARGVPMFIREDEDGSGFALWEGARFFRGDVAFEIGRIDGDLVGLRKLGRAGFLEMDPTRKHFAEGIGMPGIEEALYLATAQDFSSWPEEEDRKHVEEELVRDLKTLQPSSLHELVRYAPEAWRLWLWDRWGARIVERLSRLGLPETLPAVDPSNKLVLLSSVEAKAGWRVLPFTEAGWREYLALGGKWTRGWTELNATADLWWGRSFPRGVLAKEEPIDFVEIRTAEGHERVPALWRGKYFVIHLLPSGEEGEGVVLTHVPTGLRAGLFPSVPHARVAARYLEGLAVDWSQSDESKLSLSAALGEVLKRIRESKTPPKLEELRAEHSNR